MPPMEIPALLLLSQPPKARAGRVYHAEKAIMLKTAIQICVNNHPTACKSEEWIILLNIKWGGVLSLFCHY